MKRETHRALRDRLGAYALGQLTGADRDEAQLHLAGCAQCRAELSDIAPVAARLPALDPARLAEPTPQPPPEVLRDILRRISAEPSPATAGPRQRPMLASAAAGVLVACMLAGGGYVTGRQSASVPTEPVPISAADPTLRGTAALVAHTWGVEVKLTATGFSPGQTYRATITDRTGRQVGAGEFVGTGTEQIRCNLNSSVMRADASSFQVMDARGAVMLTAAVG